MIVIVASAGDLAAPALARSWPDAQVLTPLDFSLPGWRCRFGVRDPGTAVAGGRTIAAETITGVVTRLPVITEAEIPHIAAEDREYVAAEMQAFLFAWLSRLSCPMLNRPTVTCLSGPSWRLEKWVSVAAQLGIRVRPIVRTIRPRSTYQFPTTSADVVITVVGERSMGGDSELAEQTTRLAAAAGVGMLTASYLRTDSGAELVGVSLWPDITDPSVRDAMLHFLTSKVGAR